MKKIVRNPLIAKRAQLSLAFTLIQYLIFYTIVILVLILFPTIVKLSLEEFSLEEQLNASREFLFLDKRVVPVIVAIMLVESLHFLFITHRIFGPMKRFNSVLAAWCSGGWPKPFETRKKDFHGETLKAFNAAVETVGTDIRKARDLVGSSMETIRNNAGENIPEEFAAGFREAEEKNRQALTIIEKYFPASEGKSPPQ